MEGPTPVSALIHAATMVTAGVYMVARMHVLFSFSGTALTVVALVGAFTAVYAATMGFVQNDIKRVLAYSTISQIGYMFIGLGVGAYSGGHLPPHDPRLLQEPALPRRGERHPRPLRRAGHAEDGRPADAASPGPIAVFLIGALAIAGVPGLSGFFSKDEILASAFASGHLRRLGAGPRRRGHDGLLHVPPDLPDLLRRRAARSGERGAISTNRRRS